MGGGSARDEMHSECEIGRGRCVRAFRWGGDVSASEEEDGYLVSFFSGVTLFRGGWGEVEDD